MNSSNREKFINWYKWSLESKDCDPSIWMTNYLFDRFEHNIEQRYWISWIYGTTYHFPTTWIIWNEFPDFNLVDIGRLTDWNNKNYKRLRYQTDTKWNKGHLPEQFISYKNWVNKFGTQEYAIKRHENDFHKLWEEVNTLHKFGRYSSWFYIQTLKQCCNVNIEPSSLMLNDYSGSKSHRNGLCYALNKLDWIDKKLTIKEYSWLETQAVHIFLEVNKEYNTNFFEMETCLCSFKKLFRKSKGRYLGYYLDRQAEEIIQAEKDGWDGIDWQPLWDARNEILNKKLLTNKIDNSKMSLYLDNNILDATGIFENKNIGLEAFL
jgi:hypothetical protein